MALREKEADRLARAAPPVHVAADLQVDVQTDLIPGMPGGNGERACDCALPAGKDWRNREGRKVCEIRDSYRAVHNHARRKGGKSAVIREGEAVGAPDGSSIHLTTV